MEGWQGQGRNRTSGPSPCNLVALAGGQRGPPIGREAMTTIDFYTHVDDRLAVAARIVAKAYAAHGSVRVLTPDRATTDALDRLLWMQKPLSILPPCRMDSASAVHTPIWIDETAEYNGPSAVHVNLHADPP